MQARALILAFSALALAAQPAPKASPQRSPGAKVKTGAPIKLLELNLATQEELMRLPGVDEALAERIIAGRPYRVRTDLLTRGLVPRSLYTVLRPLVTAQQPMPSK